MTTRKKGNLKRDGIIAIDDGRVKYHFEYVNIELHDVVACYKHDKKTELGNPDLFKHV